MDARKYALLDIMQYVRIAARLPNEILTHPPLCRGSSIRRLGRVIYRSGLKRGEGDEVHDEFYCQLAFA